MAKGEKQPKYGVKIRKYTSWMVFLMFFGILSVKANGDLQDPVIAIQEKDSAYVDSNYYESIPVENTLTDSLTSAGGLSFEKMHSRYQSDAFNYDEDKIDRTSWWRRVIHRIHKFMNNLLPDWRLNLQETFYYTLIGVGLLIFIYILYRIMLNRNILGYTETKEEDSESPEWVEKKLMELNLDNFLKEALIAKDYRLAIRYLHLKNLKKLAERGRIEWQYRKTNEDFLRELKGSPWREAFSESMRIYEYIWYGGFGISEEEYQRYQRIYKEFNKQIR